MHAPRRGFLRMQSSGVALPSDILRTRLSSSECHKLPPSPSRAHGDERGAARGKLERQNPRARSDALDP